MKTAKLLTLSLAFALSAFGQVVSNPSSAAGGGTVTATGTPTSTAIVTSAGGNVVQTPSATTTLDASGNIVTPGSFTSGSGGGVAGFFSCSQGTAPSFAVNTFSLFCPTAIATAYQWKAPTADAAGAIVSNGAGTPGILSIKAIQGTDTKIMSSGTVSGTAVTLCTDANGGATTSGCSSGTAGLTYFSLAFGSASALNTVAQNTTRAWGFSLESSVTTTAITYHVATADNTANLYDICVYDSTGALKLNIGATAGTTLFAATGFRSANWTQGSTTLASGLYIIGFTSSAASPLAAFGGANTSSNLQFISAITPTGGTTTGGVCNGSLTFPSSTWAAGQVVNFGLH